MHNCRIKALKAISHPLPNPDIRITDSRDVLVDRIGTWRVFSTLVLKS
jgi:hypothetical protein